MKIASVADVKARLSAYIQACEEGPVIITRNGKPAAVLLAVQDEDELERLALAYSPKFHDVLEAARRQIQETGGVRHDEFWQEVEEDPARHPAIALCQQCTNFVALTLALPHR